MIFYNRILSVIFIGNGQFAPSFRPARSQYSAAVGCSHSGTEAVFVLSFPVRRLECSFHLAFMLFYYYCTIRVAKINPFF
jgi:hypothetical protein